MNLNGIVMLVFGVTIIAQIARGGALQRLGILPCPGGN